MITINSQILEKKGIDVEIVDPRTLLPLDEDIILESVKKTGRLVLASDAVERGSFLHTVASNIQTLAFDYLDAPVTVVGSRNAITPAAELEKIFFPQYIHVNVANKFLINGYASIFPRLFNANIQNLFFPLSLI